jgi:hypothetical protein
MPKWMHDRADHIMEKNPEMPKGEAFAIATQQMHSLGKTPKGYGTAEGKRTAKAKFNTPEDDVKTAAPKGYLHGQAFLDELAKIRGFKAGGPPIERAAGAVKKVVDTVKSKVAGTGIESVLPALGGLAAGYSPGRNVAGETAAALAPEGRRTRSENIARQAAVVGAPAGGLAALGLAHHYGLGDKLQGLLQQHLKPGSPLPAIAQYGAPLAIAAGGSLAGGALTGGATGLIQKLRGPLRRAPTAEDKKERDLIPEHQKTAGMRVDYDLDFQPVHSQTHDEWLAGLMKRDGAFLAPNSLAHVGPLSKHALAGFTSEIEKIAVSKEWLSKAVRSAKATPERLAQFAKKVSPIDVTKKTDKPLHAASEASDRLVEETVRRFGLHREA